VKQVESLADRRKGKRSVISADEEEVDLDRLKQNADSILQNKVKETGLESIEE
jgi:hypothetical protein